MVKFHAFFQKLLNLKIILYNFNISGLKHREYFVLIANKGLDIYDIQRSSNLKSFNSILKGRYHHKKLFLY